jgi:hypothetical protein
MPWIGERTRKDAAEVGLPAPEVVEGEPMGRTSRWSQRAPGRPPLLVPVDGRAVPAAGES